MIYPKGLMIARKDSDGKPEIVPWEAFSNLDAKLSDLLGAIAAIDPSVAKDNLYFAKQEVVPGVPDHEYELGFTGRGGYIRVNKPLIVKLNDSGNNPFTLPAGPELLFRDMEITSILLSSVQANTEVEILFTGRL